MRKFIDVKRAKSFFNPMEAFDQALIQAKKSLILVSFDTAFHKTEIKNNIFPKSFIIDYVIGTLYAGFF